MDVTSIAVQSSLILVVFGVLFLVLVQPQQRRLHRHRMMLANLRPGDRVATSGGLVGTVVAFASEQTVMSEVASNIQVTIIRNRIDAVLNENEQGIAVNLATACAPEPAEHAARGAGACEPPPHASRACHSLNPSLHSGHPLTTGGGGP